MAWIVKAITKTLPVMQCFFERLTEVAISAGRNHVNVINETRLDFFPFGYAVFVAFAYQSTTRPGT